MSHAQAAHLCASLPKIHLTVDLVFCQVHQAYTARVSAYNEDGTEILYLGQPVAVEFGPFDGWADVVEWVHVQLRDAALQDG